MVGELQLAVWEGKWAVSDRREYSDATPGRTGHREGLPFASFKSATTRRPAGCPSGSRGQERPRKAQDGQRRGRPEWDGRAAVKRASPPKRTCPQADYRSGR